MFAKRSPLLFALAALALVAPARGEAQDKKAGVEVRLVKVEGAGHGGAPFNAPENRKLVEEFFDKHLKAKK
jgi:hypothetical protein